MVTIHPIIETGKNIQPAFLKCLFIDPTFSAKLNYYDGLFPEKHFNSHKKKENSKNPLKQILREFNR